MNDTQPLITVVIPVYNAASTLRRCLDSVTGSSFAPLEILCVDDGSEDGSVPIIRAYAEKDPRVRLLTQEHRYAGAARNAGIEAASGTYLHFLDADDEILPTAYGILFRAAEEAHADVCECLYENRDAVTGSMVSAASFIRRDEDAPLNIRTGGERTAISLIDGHVVPWNKLYRREFLLASGVRFDGLICAEDRSFYYGVIFAAGTLVRIQDRLVIHYINSPTSLEGSDTRIRHFDVHFRSSEIIREIVKDEPDHLRSLVAGACLSDSVYHFYPALGTPCEDDLRRQLYRYWKPLLGDLSMHSFRNATFFHFLNITESLLPKAIRPFIRYPVRRFLKACTDGGPHAREKMRFWKMMLLPAFFFRRSLFP